MKMRTAPHDPLQPLNVIDSGESGRNADPLLSHFSSPVYHSGPGLLQLIRSAVWITRYPDIRPRSRPGWWSGAEVVNRRSQWEGGG